MRDWILLAALLLSVLAAAIYTVVQSDRCEMIGGMMLRGSGDLFSTCIKVEKLNQFKGESSE